MSDQASLKPERISVVVFQDVEDDMQMIAQAAQRWNAYQPPWGTEQEAAYEVRLAVGVVELGHAAKRLERNLKSIQRHGLTHQLGRTSPDKIQERINQAEQLLKGLRKHK